MHEVTGDSPQSDLFHSILNENNFDDAGNALTPNSDAQARVNTPIAATGRLSAEITTEYMNNGSSGANRFHNQQNKRNVPPKGRTVATTAATTTTARTQRYTLDEENKSIDFHANNSTLRRGDAYDVVIMRHEQRRRIMLNRNHLGLLMNVLAFAGIATAIAGDHWFSTASNNVIRWYGLLYYSECVVGASDKTCAPGTSSKHIGTFKKNLLVSGGIITFVIIGIGVALHATLLIQNLSVSLGRRCKVLKFKVLRYFVTIFYCAGNGYYFVVVLLPGLTTGNKDYLHLHYDFFVCISCVAAFVLVCVYFSWLKKRQIDAEIINNLLHASSIIKEQESEENSHNTDNS